MVEFSVMSSLSISSTLPAALTMATLTVRGVLAPNWLVAAPAASVVVMIRLREAVGDEAAIAVLTANGLSGAS